MIIGDYSVRVGRGVREMLVDGQGAVMMLVAREPGKGMTATPKVSDYQMYISFTN